MRRAPRPHASAASRTGAFLVGFLAAAVIGGTAYGWDHWRDDVAVATASDFSPASGDHASAWKPDAPTPAVGEAPRTPDDSADPTGPVFDPLTTGRGADRPVVLLVGDGYADGQGASSAGTSYASLLARDLGWDIRLATAPAAGYVSDSRTLLDLLNASRVDLDPALVIVQGGYGGPGADRDARTAVLELDTAVRQRWGDVPVAVVTPFVMEATEQAATRERTIARAWRTDPSVLLVRPQPEGWGVVDTRGGPPDDTDHARLAAGIAQALRTAGLSSN